MLDQRFYWGTIRKSIVAFGNMFNNINVERRDADGNIVQILKVNKFKGFECLKV